MAMLKCDWCGRRYSEGDGWSAGPRWNKRHYCSKLCCNEGEDNLTEDEIREDNMSFGERLVRSIKNLIKSFILFVIVVAIIFILVAIFGK